MSIAPRPPIAAHARALQESPTMAITARAKELTASGEDVISLAAGEPDAPTPPRAVEAAQEAAADPAAHKYSPAPGQPWLRRRIAEKTQRDSHIATDPANVIVTPGGKYACYAIFQMLCEAGDEVILPAPYWVSYPAQIRLAGAEPVEVLASAEQGYRVTPEMLEAARTERTKAIVFNAPNNPTGAVYPPEEVAAIGRWARDAGVWVITDEIYEHLTYGGARAASILEMVPELSDQTILVNGMSKTYAMTGWRIGWAVAPEPAATALRRFAGQTTSNLTNVAQAAAAAALDGALDDLPRLREAYDRRRQLAVKELSAIPGVTCPEPLGAFYAFPNVEGLLETEIAGRRVDSSVELCEAVLEATGVALVPGEGFGAPGCVRLSYALDDERLAAGLERLRKALAPS